MVFLLPIVLPAQQSIVIELPCVRRERLLTVPAVFGLTQWLQNGYSRPEHQLNFPSISKLRRRRAQLAFLDSVLTDGDGRGPCKSNRRLKMVPLSKCSGKAL
jgi:hypothetical protein